MDKPLRLSFVLFVDVLVYYKFFLQRVLHLFYVLLKLLLSFGATKLHQETPVILFLSIYTHKVNVVVALRKFGIDLLYRYCLWKTSCLFYKVVEYTYNTYFL